MVKTSLRTLLSHCSREHSESGDFFFLHLICITMSTAPALLPCCKGQGSSDLLDQFLGPCIPLGSSFLSMLKVFGTKTPNLTGFRWEVCFRLGVHMWAFGILFPGLTEFPLSPLPSNHCRMLPIKQAGQIPRDWGH